jgi:type I restriction-modification system DNA methylase subunit
MPDADLKYEIQQHLDHDGDDLGRLFAETLNWGAAPRAAAQTVRLPVPVSLTVTPVAKLGGLPVLRVVWPGDRLPTVTERRQVYRQLAGTYAEHLLCYATADGRQRAFVWARQRSGSQVELRTLPYEAGTPARTTIDRLAELAFSFDELTAGEPSSAAVLDRLNRAFDVEAVTDQFFRDYRQVFEKVEASVEGIADDNDRRLYTQRLFNRLMFLYFIQKKGWLSFDGNRNYLRALFNVALANREDFLHDRLYWTFFHGLNTPGESHESHSMEELRRLRGDVPFLNGGLFDLEDDYDTQGRLTIPAESFGAILDLFERYNFTVTESTPFDVEVAVDPEMLGKVFEELVTGRHETGSYYTPRPIVAYMCREALKLYLEPAGGAEAVACFVDEGDASRLRDPEKVLEALKRIRFCDPACGSGAYPLGMMQELLRLRERLFTARGLDAVTIYQRKLEIIENSVYGVDIDPFAVNIAMLRLWLSLAIDYDGPEPPPLPNLKFKVEVGDSLTAPDPRTVSDLFRRLLIEKADEIRSSKHDYLEAQGYERKAELERRIREKEQELRDNLGGAAAPEGALDWRVSFAEVFERGGFDIVLANPPYVRQEIFKGDYKERLLRPLYPTVFVGTADLYVYFYARAHQLLRDGGVGCFISSNKWLRAGYGEKLRQHLLDSQAFHLVLDFGDQPVFNATAYPAIFIWQRLPRGTTPTRWAVVADLKTCYDEGIRQHIDRIAATVPASQFGKGKPRLMQAKAVDRRRQMESKGIPLGEYAAGRMFNGVKAGLQNAFLIDRSTRDMLIAADSRSAELVKPYRLGDDVRRYECHYRDNYLLYVRWDTDIKSYPAVRNWLAEHKTALRKRDGVKDNGPCPWFALSRPRPESQAMFEAPKVVYPDIAKERRFAMDSDGFYCPNTTYCIGLEDWYLLGVLNSIYTEQYLEDVGAKIRGGYLRFFGQYLENIPIPDAPAAASRREIGVLAQKTQSLCLERRTVVVKLLGRLGITPAESDSRNPLEQPWSLQEDQFTRRKGADHLRHFRGARDQTLALTEQIQQVERQIDELVAGLYGLA